MVLVVIKAPEGRRYADSIHGNNDDLKPGIGYTVILYKFTDGFKEIVT